MNITVGEARRAVIAAVREYMSDRVQGGDDKTRAQAYSVMFRAMQDLDIAEWMERQP